MQVTLLTKKGFELAALSIQDLILEHRATFDYTDYELSAQRNGDVFTVYFHSDDLVDTYSEGELRSLLVSNMIEYFLENGDPDQFNEEADLSELL